MTDQRRDTAGRERESTQRGEEVQEHRDHLCAAKTGGRHQREVGQEAAECRAGRVDPVENGDPPAACLGVASNEMPNEERQRPAHQQRDRRQQDDGDSRAGQIRGRREDVLATGPRE